MIECGFCLLGILVLFMDEKLRFSSININNDKTNSKKRPNVNKVRIYIGLMDKQFH